VLGFYKTLVTTEEERTFARHRLISGNKVGLDDKNDVTEAANGKIRNEESSDGDIRSIEEAKIRIRELEGKLQHLEAAIKNGVAKDFPTVKFLNYKNRKRILVTGGAGFVGSHLVDHLMLAGHEVIVVDNFFTGRKRNIEHWVGHENFELVHHDIVRPLYLEVDEIYHLASPASPPHYMLNPVKTIKTNTLGTINMLGKHFMKRYKRSSLFSYVHQYVELVPTQGQIKLYNYRTRETSRCASTDREHVGSLR